MKRQVGEKSGDLSGPEAADRYSVSRETEAAEQLNSPTFIRHSHSTLSKAPRSNRRTVVFNKLAVFPL